MYIWGDIFFLCKGQLQFPKSCMSFAMTGSFLNSVIQVNHRSLEAGVVVLSDLPLSISHGDLGVGTFGAPPGLTPYMSSVLTL